MLSKHFKQLKTQKQVLIKIILGTLVVSSSMSSCGKKEKNKQSIEFQSDLGCLNQIADHVKLYIDGSISEEKWTSSFRCIETKVDYFLRVAKASSNEGYTTADIAGLMRRFILTSKPFSNQFVSQILELKASVVGGQTQTVTADEIREFLKLVKGIEKETLDILPYIREYRKNPNFDSVESLGYVIKESTRDFARYFVNQNNQYFKKESLEGFLKELLAIVEVDSRLIDKYSDLAGELKVFVAGGLNDRIESKRWPQMITELGEMTSLYLMYTIGQDLSDKGSIDYNKLVIKMSDQVENYLYRFIEDRGMGIPFIKLVPLIRTLPLDSLNEAKRNAFINDIPNFINKVLKSNTPNYLDRVAIRTLFEFIREGFQNQNHIKTIYQGFSDQNNVSLEEFEVSTRSYLSGLKNIEDKNQVRSLMILAKSFYGMIDQEPGQVVFDPKVKAKRTYNHMSRMQWYRLGVQYLFNAYASGSDGNAQFEDFYQLIKDYQNIVRVFGKSNPKLSIENMTKKRFRDANLFVPSSNGDIYVDQMEATYYLAILVSSGDLSSNMFSSMSEDWNVCPVIGVDDIGLSAIDLACFQKNYFANTKHFWRAMPFLNTYYQTRSAQSKFVLEQSIIKAAYRDDMTKDRISIFDMDSYSAIPHYVEVMMDRFDSNSNQILEKEEILYNAYPVFRGELQKLSKNKSDKFLQAVLTYAIKYGKFPQSTGEKIHFLAWKATRPFWKVTANRGSLYKILALLSDGALSPANFTEAEDDDQLSD